MRARAIHRGWGRAALRSWGALHMAALLYGVGGLSAGCTGAEPGPSSTQSAVSPSAQSAAASSTQSAGSPSAQSAAASSVQSAAASSVQSAAASSVQSAAASSALAHQHDEASDLWFVERLIGGAQPGQAVPLIVAIHGLGDRPEAFARLFETLRVPARLLLPRGKHSWGRGYSWFHMEGERREADAIESGQRLVKLIEARRAAQPTEGRPLITGFSQGGILSYWLAAHHPQLCARAVPIAGTLTPGTWPPAAAEAERADEAAPLCTIWGLHGEADERVPFASAQQTVAALRERGLPAQLEGFPGLGHRISPALRAQLERHLGASSGTP